MDRLSALDASFLHLDTPATPMHIASLAIYEAPSPDTSELHDTLERRLHLVPRFREKLGAVPFNYHRPQWIPDNNFDLEGHLRHIVLPEPGDDAALKEVCGNLFSLPLDRTRPLWEMWLIDGLDGGRFAVLSKTHHALWDGVSGADLHGVILDDSPDADDPPPTAGTPPRAPSALERFVRAAADRTTEPLEIAGSITRAARNPRSVLREAERFVSGGLGFAKHALRPAPPTPLNVRTGSRRRYEIVRSSLADTRTIAKTFDTTINDVVLTAVSGAIRAWLIHRDVEPCDVRVMVPVSLRTDDESNGGNRVAMIIAELPTSEPHPLDRLEIIHRTMEREKRSDQVRTGELVARMAGFVPPQLIAQLTRFQSVARWFNLVVTNIPGPQFPLYLRGRRLLELYPQAPLAARQGLAVAAMSYDGKMGFGLLADRDALPDVDVIANELDASIAELIGAAGAEQPKPSAPIDLREYARAATARGRSA